MSESVVVDGGRVVCDIRGEGRPNQVVIRPGFRMHLDHYLPLANQLVDLFNAEVHLVQNPGGFGTTGLGRGASNNEHADWSRMVYQTRGIRPGAIYLGESLGGGEQKLYVARYPDDVGALIGLSPNGWPVDGQGDSDQWLALAGSVDNSMSFGTRLELMMQAPVILAGALTGDPDVRFASRLDTRSSDLSIGDRRRRGERPIPTLLVGGDRDKAITPDNLLLQAEALGAAVLTVHGGGHWVGSLSPSVWLAHAERFMREETQIAFPAAEPELAAAETAPEFGRLTPARA